MALSDQSSVDHLESSDQLGPKTFEERDTNYNLLSQEHTSAVTSFKNIGVSSEKIKFSHNSRQADIEEDKLSDISDVDEYIVGKEESIANKTLNILTGIAQPHCSQTNSLNYLCVKGLELYRNSVHYSVLQKRSSLKKNFNYHAS